MTAEKFFNAEEKQTIVNAIKQAETDTSGEIRVHIETKCKGDVLDRAVDVFAALKMHKTELRNGVLFYLSTEDHQFAILGDAGINAKVPTNFWDNIKEHVIAKFKIGEFTNGLAEGIVKAGEQLKSHFPYQRNDINELNDDISFEKIK